MRLATSMTIPGETRSRGMPGPNRPAPPFIASTTAKAGVSGVWWPSVAIALQGQGVGGGRVMVT